MFVALAAQFAATGLQAGQVGLNRKQLVFAQGLDLRLQGLQFGGGPIENPLAGADGFLLQPLLLHQGGGLLLQPLPLTHGLLPGQHLLLFTANLQPLAQVLIETGLGAVPLQLLAGVEQLLLDNAAAILTLLHFIELAAALVNAGIEKGDASQFIDDAATLAGAHRHDAGHIPLHHHVAAVRINPQATQLGLQLLQVAGHPAGAVAAGVGTARGHPQATGDAPLALADLDPGSLRWGIQTALGCIGLPVTQIKMDGDAGLGGPASTQHRAVNQIGQPFGAHAPAVSQAEAKKHRIQNVALA